MIHAKMCAQPKCVTLEYGYHIARTVLGATVGDGETLYPSHLLVPLSQLLLQSWNTTEKGTEQKKAKFHEDLDGDKVTENLNKGSHTCRGG